jgi:hypothetical protein
LEYSELAYNLLVNDRAKFTALLIGITFAVVLMTEITVMFAGVLNRASATVINMAGILLNCRPERPERKDVSSPSLEHFHFYSEQDRAAKCGFS